MQNKNVFQKYQSLLAGEPAAYYRDYLLSREKLKDSSAYYHGEPIDFLYQPLFFSREEYSELKLISDRLCRILRKVIEEYRTNQNFRRYFGFPGLMEELTLIDPGYSNEFPVARFDIFYGNKFCEFNTDGSSAMNEVRVLQKIIAESRAFREATAGIQTEGFELFYSLIDTVLENFQEFNGGCDDRPNLAIVDFKGEGTVNEFKEFQKRFKERGCRAVICDPRELQYRGGRLYYQELEIPLIYRRATTIRLVEEAESISDFLQAYREGAVCVVGGLVSQVIHNKIIFAVLHDRAKVPFLTDEEYAFILKYIPRTVVFAAENGELMREVADRKDEFMLKPTDGAAASGVYCGRDYSLQEWQQLMTRAAAQDYLVQEFVPIPRIKMPTAAEGGLFYEDYGFLLGLFLYNQQLTGLYTRAGRKNIIGSAGETFTAANYLMEAR